MLCSGAGFIKVNKVINIINIETLELAVLSKDGRGVVEEKREKKENKCLEKKNLWI